MKFDEIEWPTSPQYLQINFLNGTSFELNRRELDDRPWVVELTVNDCEFCWLIGRRRLGGSKLINWLLVLVIDELRIESMDTCSWFDWESNIGAETMADVPIADGAKLL